FVAQFALQIQTLLKIDRRPGIVPLTERQIPQTGRHKGRVSLIAQTPNEQEGFLVISVRAFAVLLKDRDIAQAYERVGDTERVVPLSPERKSLLLKRAGGRIIAAGIIHVPQAAEGLRHPLGISLVLEDCQGFLMKSARRRIVVLVPGEHSRD